MEIIGHQSSSTSVTRNEEDQLLNSRYNINASLDSNSLTDVVIVDEQTSEPTSMMLHFCQKRQYCFWVDNGDVVSFKTLTPTLGSLVPYVNILGIVGLRPITVDSTCCSIWFGHLQTSIIVVLLLLGYVIQYLTGFRRDRGAAAAQNVMITFETNSLNPNRTTSVIGETIFVFVVPGLLHFCGFLSAIYVLRIADNEQLQNLVERVFILCQFPNRLILVLWLYILCGTIWLTFMIWLVFVEISSSDIGLNLRYFKNIPEIFQHWTRTFLIISIISHDLAQMIVLSSYGIQCYLLKHYLYILNEKLIQNTIEPIDWMREMCEFRKLLHHLNKRTAKPVCFFTILNITYAIAGFAYLIKTYVESNAPIKMFSLNVGNILLWLIIGLYPFFQGASLSEACLAARTSGHQIRIRPFLHHNTSSEDLNSVLLYSSSLQMAAKLFRMPIQGNYLFCAILLLIIIILAMGMCVKVYLGLS